MRSHLAAALAVALLPVSGCVIESDQSCPCCSDPELPDLPDFCTDHEECPPGDWCGENRCIASGFCEIDLDCPIGFVCDERDTCVPHDNREPCDQHHDCAMGQYCGDTGYCVSTSMCCTDQLCGWDNVPSDCAPGYECDDPRLTCMPCPPGECLCDGQADCEPGQYCEPETGACFTPECAEIGEEQLCFERFDCALIYAGIGCTTPDGSPCQDGSSDCTCAEFDFVACVARD